MYGHWRSYSDRTRPKYSERNTLESLGSQIPHGMPKGSDHKGLDLDFSGTLWEQNINVTLFSVFIALSSRKIFLTVGNLGYVVCLILPAPLDFQFCNSVTQSQAGGRREGVVFGEDKRWEPCKHLFIICGLWNAVRDEKLCVYKAIQWDSPAKAGKKIKSCLPSKVFYFHVKVRRFPLSAFSFPYSAWTSGICVRNRHARSDAVSSVRFLKSSFSEYINKAPSCPSVCLHVCTALFLQNSLP